MNIPDQQTYIKSSFKLFRAIKEDRDGLIKCDYIASIEENYGITSHTIFNPNRILTNLGRTWSLARQLLLKLIATDVIDNLAWLGPLDFMHKAWELAQSQPVNKKDFRMKMNDMNGVETEVETGSSQVQNTVLRSERSTKSFINDEDLSQLKLQIANPVNQGKWKDYAKLVWTFSNGNVDLSVNLSQWLLGFSESCSGNYAFQVIEKYVRTDPSSVLNNVRAMHFVVNKTSTKHNLSHLWILSLWDLENYPISFPKALYMLGKDYSTRDPPDHSSSQDNKLAVTPDQESRKMEEAIYTNSLVSSLGIDALKMNAEKSPESVSFYMQQLMQTLRNNDLKHSMKEFVVFCVEKSSLVAHQFIWNMRANEYRFDPEGRAEHKDKGLYDTCKDLKQTIVDKFNPAQKEFYEREFSFFKDITQISAKIKDGSLADGSRKKKCMKEIGKVKMVDGCYLPSNPTCLVKDINRAVAIPLQSHAKAPYLAEFFVQEFGFEDLEKFAEKDDAERKIIEKEHANAPIVPQKAIFKVGDDIRQDVLALQITEIFSRAFQEAGLNLYVYPYKVVATDPGCGVIECVPESASRDQLGRQTNSNLLEYFEKQYGQVHSKEFQQARKKYIESLAAYSIVLYILQIKDRHNGNFMLTTDGYLVHIDFGFMFESSPGGNMGFETDFKLCHEMVSLMCGKPYSQVDDPAITDCFKQFEKLLCRAFLAIRPYSKEIITLVDFMLETELPCFRGNTLSPLKSRFCPGASQKEAVSHIRHITHNICYLSKRTHFYDHFQWIQNKIPYF